MRNVSTLLILGGLDESLSVCLDANSPESFGREVILGGHACISEVPACDFIFVFLQLGQCILQTGHIIRVLSTDSEKLQLKVSLHGHTAIHSELVCHYNG